MTGTKSLLSLLTTAMGGKISGMVLAGHCMNRIAVVNDGRTNAGKKSAAA